jgi:hypothetical protein
VPTVPPTGAGGTYIYGSAGAARLSHASALSGSAFAAPSSLPRTGGGGGPDPTSPLAPLALLAALGIGAGRFIRRFMK